MYIMVWSFEVKFVYKIKLLKWNAASAKNNNLNTGNNFQVEVNRDENKWQFIDTTWNDIFQNLRVISLYIWKMKYIAKNQIWCLSIKITVKCIWDSAMQKKIYTM
jgi:pyruvate carboxylase